MKIKDGLEISTGEFWYDLADGGYLKPEEILVDEKDVQAVKQAIKIIREFESSCEEQIEDFYR